MWVPGFSGSDHHSQRDPTERKVRNGRAATNEYRACGEANSALRNSTTPGSPFSCSTSVSGECGETVSSISGRMPGTRSGRPRICALSNHATVAQTTRPRSQCGVSESYFGDTILVFLCHPPQQPDRFIEQRRFACVSGVFRLAVAQCGGSAVHDGLRRVLRKDLKQQAKFLWQIQLRAIEAIFELKTLRFDLKPHYTVGQKNVEHELGVIFDSVPQVSDDFCP